MNLAQSHHQFSTISPVTQNHVLNSSLFSSITVEINYSKSSEIFINLSCHIVILQLGEKLQILYLFNLSVLYQYQNQVTNMIPVACGLSFHCNMLCYGLYGATAMTR